jgi:hypothetical protein
MTSHLKENFQEIIKPKTDEIKNRDNVFAHIFLHAIITKKLYLCTVCWHRITCF